MTDGAAHVELLRRTDPILYIIEDRWSDTSCIYIGKTPAFDTLTSQSKWQIQRVTFDGTKLVTQFGNNAKFNCIWDNRASYFGPSGGIPIPGDVVSGSFTLSGLNIAGKISEVTLDALSWTALPAVPLVNRNAMSIQNQSLIEIKLNYDNLEPGYVGVKLGSNAERYYDIKDSIVIYAKAQSGTPTILIEEIS